MDCQIEAYDWDVEYRKISCEIIVARKPKICGECRRTIEPNESYELYVGESEGQIYNEITCSDCMSLCEGFSNNSSRIFGNLKEQIAERIWEIGGEVDNSCIQPLTESARDFVFGEIENVWESFDEKG